MTPVPATRKMGFRDIKAEVLNRIQTGTWGPDALLPSETDLAEEFATTRTTVNRALRELAEEGFLDRRRKAGTRVLRAPVRRAHFVIPQAAEEITATGQSYRYALISQNTGPAPEWLTARLGLAREDTTVVHLRAIHYADNSPFQFEDRWIISATAPLVQSADFTSIPPGTWLTQQMPFTNAEVSFSATAADQELSQFMEVADRDPLFLVERTTWLQDQPVTFVRLYHRVGYKMTTAY